MFKKIVSLTISVIMVMALIAVPTQAAAFSDDNYAQFYNDLETVGGDFTGEVIETTNLGGKDIKTHVKVTGPSTYTLQKDRKPIKYATWRSHGDDNGAHTTLTNPKYSHIRLMVGAHEDNGSSGMGWSNVYSYVITENSDKYWAFVDDNDTGGKSANNGGGSYTNSTGEDVDKYSYKSGNQKNGAYTVYTRLDRVPTTYWEGTEYEVVGGNPFFYNGYEEKDLGKVRYSFMFMKSNCVYSDTEVHIVGKKGDEEKSVKLMNFSANQNYYNYTPDGGIKIDGQGKREWIKVVIEVDCANGTYKLGTSKTTADPELTEYQLPEGLDSTYGINFECLQGGGSDNWTFIDNIKFDVMAENVSTGMTGLDTLWISQHYKASGSGTNAFAIRDDGRAFGRGDSDNTLEIYSNDLWSLRTSITDESFHKIDLIVDHKGVGQDTAISYLFIDGKYAGTHYNTEQRSAVAKEFYGIDFKVLSGKTVNKNTIIEAKFDKGREGHREYYDTDDYTVTLEDVMMDAGLGTETTEENVIYHTTDLARYMPGADQGRTLYYKQDDANKSRVLNQNVTYNGTAATVEFDGDSDSWELAADLLAFYPYSKTDGRKTGLSYTSYHPRAKYVKFSFNQTIAEDGDSNLQYTMLGGGDNTLMKMRDNGGKLVIDLVGTEENVAKTSNGDTYGTNKIDWVIEFQDPEVDDSFTAEGIVQYVFVNGEKVAESPYATSSLRVNNIRLFGKHSMEVTYDNWSMTLYNQDADIDDIQANITGVEPSASFKWIEDECGIEKDEDLFVVFAGAEAKHFEGEAKFLVAVYAEDRTLLDVSIADFESGVVIGNEDEPRIFDASEYSKPVDYVCVYLMEDGIKPLITQKTISFN